MSGICSIMWSRISRSFQASGDGSPSLTDRSKVTLSLLTALRRAASSIGSARVILSSWAAFSTVTKVLDEGKTPEEMLAMLLGDMDLEIMDTMPARFFCNCDKKRVEKAIISIGEKDIKEMIEDGKEIEVNCHFCNTAYHFSVEELKDMLKRCKR